MAAKLSPASSTIFSLPIMRRRMIMMMVIRIMIIMTMIVMMMDMMIMMMTQSAWLRSYHQPPRQ
jgi:hypothetical protein